MKNTLIGRWFRLPRICFALCLYAMVTSDGFQTFNHQQRVAGDVKLQYKFSDKLVLTGYSGWVMLDNNTPPTLLLLLVHR